MKGLKLSERASKDRKIIWSGGGKVGIVVPQAITKLKSDKPAHVEALNNSLARVWCPLKAWNARFWETTFFCLLSISQRGRGRLWRRGHGSLERHSWWLRILFQQKL